MRRDTNHLAGQTSPYLLQHVHNPVNWHPWGEPALSKARQEDKPIFLSIGYAACHWCHVMERESFENDSIADFLNEHFVSIKVDREERPDLDEIYMTAVQLMTGSGGWPLNVFLTPDLKPFVGGTYFPPEDRHGRPGFLEVLRKIREAWSSRREEIERAGEELTRSVRAVGTGRTREPGGGAVGRGEFASAVAELTRRFDGRWGGFGPAPKFPPHGGLSLLLREHRRNGDEIPLEMVEVTLRSMYRGGMYDHIGGGFARYSTDERWLVPHFEKMLYDQALLVPVYVNAWLVTRRPSYRRVVEDTLDFVRREMTDRDGAFFSSLDADSEGVEGKFYVWTPREIAEVLGAEDADFFCSVYDVTDAGNFEGKSIPNLLGGSLEERAREAGVTEDALEARLRPMRERLLEARERRNRPGTDDKILAAWNGLMITAFARAHQALGRQEDLDAASGAADFVLARLADGGRLKVSYREGRARLNGYLDDYAFLARGLLDLYECRGDRGRLEAAAELATTLVARFEDAEHGGFFFTSDDHETLLSRNKSTHDGALPSGAGVAVETLSRLAVHLNRDDLREPAVRTLRAYRAAVESAPSAFASLLLAADFLEGPVLEIALVGRESPGFDDLHRVVRSHYLPNRIVAIGDGDDPRSGGLPLLDGKSPVNGRAAAYVCRDYACRAPVTDPEALAEALR